MKRATDNAEKEYLENMCKEITEFQSTGRYDLMYMKTKELGWKETFLPMLPDLPKSNAFCKVPWDRTPASAVLVGD